MEKILNPVELAEKNLKEAERQLRKAQSDHEKGEISEERLQQFEHLQELCATDLQRVIREN
ncbi:hypothetical protein [Psychromicrobium sp. YIM B11713]|uniref:hypothetical protein n=1 Tax=Psychromicrobium sp. YIM B11713 TaxID=3145233 RepID=UPI00374FA888